MDKIVIHPPSLSPSTDFYIGHRLLKSHLIPDLCKEWGHRTAIIADSMVAALYGTELALAVKGELFTIPSGERSKCRKTKELLEDQLLEKGYGRDTVLVALGGGVTTDLVGFVASTYLRGVPLLLIPTTLLAIVDAAIGGKTAVDTPFGKNLIGTIFHPKAIVADLDLLAELPEKERVNGLAEILKMGLIFDSSLWEMAEKNLRDEKLILKAAKGKIAVIEQDAFETGMRRILNFGHTIGHALERIAHYEIAHGEAVILGCLTEGYLSYSLGYLPESDWKRIQALYKTLAYFPQLPKGYRREDLLMAMSSDKKKAFGQVRFVLIDTIGHTLPFDGDYCRPASEKELEGALAWMEKAYG